MFNKYMFLAVLLLTGCSSTDRGDNLYRFGDKIQGELYSDVPLCSQITLSRVSGPNHWPECVIR